MVNDEKHVKMPNLLTDLEFCHVINTRSGKLSLIEGPHRFGIGMTYKMHGSVRTKIVLAENQYAVVLNPRDRRDSKKQMSGKWELRKGSMTFSLYPGEELWTGEIKQVLSLKMGEYVVVENPIEDNQIMYGKRKTIVGPTSYMPLPGEIYKNMTTTIVLEKGQGIYVKALVDFNDDGIERKAGDHWLIKGPAYYLPPDTVMVTKREVKEISLSEHSGVYIKDVIKGSIRLERGAKTIMLEPHEMLWEKDYTQSEIIAIWRPTLPEGSDRNRGKKFDSEEAVTFQKYDAQPLWVLENEAMKVMSQDDKTRIEFGPKVILLEPFERPFVMSIAGGTPKNTKRLKIWKIKLGPNFSTDVLDVRTKDNAEIQIRVRYMWRFNVDKKKKEDADLIFSVSDFVGLATETLASKIRDEAANHPFEELHSKCTEILKKAVFGDADYFEFPNKFKVEALDIKEIKPKDPKIADKLNEAIKSNMDIYVNKIKFDAENKTEKERKELISSQTENIKLEMVGKAQAEADAIRTRAKAEAEAIKLKKVAEAEGEAEKMKKIMDLLAKDENSKKYLDFLNMESIKNVEKLVIVPDGAGTFLTLPEMMLKKK